MRGRYERLAYGKLAHLWLKQEAFDRPALRLQHHDSHLGQAAAGQWTLQASDATPHSRHSVWQQVAAADSGQQHALLRHFGMV